MDDIHEKKPVRMAINSSFAYDENGIYGYRRKVDGADTVIPFKGGLSSLQIIELKKSIYGTNHTPSIEKTVHLKKNNQYILDFSIKSNEQFAQLNSCAIDGITMYGLGNYGTENANYNVKYYLAYQDAVGTPQSNSYRNDFDYFILVDVKADFNLKITLSVNQTRSNMSCTTTLLKL